MTLRRAVLALGCALLLGAVVTVFMGIVLFSLDLALFGLILAGGVAFERWRYKPGADKMPAPGSQPTGERFIDPESGDLVEVYYEPDSGKRTYVVLDDPKHRNNKRV